MATASNPLPAHLSIHRYQRTNQCYIEDLGNGVGLKLMRIPAGEFLMGQSAAETAELKRQMGEEDYQRFYARELPQHRVQVRSFLLGKYPVTQAQWRVVAGWPQIECELDPDPASFKGDSRPVEQVSWDGATEFCQRLARRTGKAYRLPSEAQWEYACRAGTTTPFHFGETITADLANYLGTSTYGDGPEGEYRKQTTDVGSFPANPWGLCDMHGNVLEWCEDDFHRSYEGAPTDGSAWVEADRTKTNRLLRGGSWLNLPRSCRSAYRYSLSRDYRSLNIGFRVCCEPPGLGS
jgi:formylglycine-generating enzyme required for sulfatase activity